MSNVRWYTVVYVALMTLAIGKVVFFRMFDYWLALGLTMGAVTIKSLLIMGDFQHLRHEPRSVTYIVGMAFLAVGLLASAASYSIL